MDDPFVALINELRRIVALANHPPLADKNATFADVLLPLEDPVTAVDVENYRSKFFDQAGFFTEYAGELVAADHDGSLISLYRESGIRIFIVQGATGARGRAPIAASQSPHSRPLTTVFYQCDPEGGPIIEYTSDGQVNVYERTGGPNDPGDPNVLLQWCRLSLGQYVGLDHYEGLSAADNPTPPQGVPGDV